MRAGIGPTLSIRRSWMVSSLCLLLVGCYQSQGRHGDAGGSVRDSGGLGPDTAVPSTDAGPPCTLAVLDRIEVDWPMTGCGTATAPQVVPVSRGRQTFALVVGEERLCDDRPGQLYTRSLEARSDAFVPGAPSTLGFYPGGGLHAASSGPDVGVCAGRSIFVAGTGSAMEVELRPELTAGPSCSAFSHCNGLAADGGGWTVGWLVSRCGEVTGEFGRWTHLGDPRGVILPTGKLPVDVADTRSGAVAVSRLRGTSAGVSSTVFEWPRIEDRVRELDVVLDGPFGGGSIGIVAPAAIAAWGADGAYALVFVGDEILRIVVIDGDGRVLIRRDHPMAELSTSEMRYYVEAVATDFGLLVLVGGVSIYWSGREYGRSYRVVALGTDGRLLGVPFDSVVREEEAPAPPYADIAWDGTHGLLHRVLRGDTTEALLLGCR